MRQCIQEETTSSDLLKLNRDYVKPDMREYLSVAKGSIKSGTVHI